MMGMIKAAAKLKQYNMKAIDKFVDFSTIDWKPECIIPEKTVVFADDHQNFMKCEAALMQLPRVHRTD